jgi:hypothetical protein
MGVGRYLRVFYGISVSFSARVFKNTQTTIWGKSMSKKLRKQDPVVSPLRFLLIAFLAVSLREELKNAIQIFSKIRPKNFQNPKKNQKKVGR